MVVSFNGFGTPICLQVLGDVGIHIDDIGFRPDHAPMTGNRSNGIGTEILHPIPIAVVVDLLPDDRELPLSVVGAVCSTLYFATSPSSIVYSRYPTRHLLYLYLHLRHHLALLYTFKSHRIPSHRWLDSTLLFITITTR